MMKLSKKGRSRQRAIRKALAAGKALGGLLAGLAASVVSGCSEHSPANTMGRYPSPDTPREVKGHRRADVMGRMLLTPEDECTNAVNKAEGETTQDGKTP